jgi:hypothetical protein
VRAGVGPAGGTRLRLDPDLVFLLQGSYLFYPEQPDDQIGQLDGTLRWSFVHDWALSLEGGARHDRTEAELLLMAYF